MLAIHRRSTAAARILLWSIAALFILGRSYHVIAWNFSAKRAPEPGHLVDTGSGLRLQLFCSGERGQPTVILESGLGDILEQWRRVQPAVSSFARVCSYDRAGYGNSDPGPFPRTSQQIAQELHALLQHAGERPPYLLAGHSAGGYHVRVFHGLYPSEVAAMLLIDATQEDQYRLLPPAWTSLGKSMLERYRSQARWAPLEVEFGFKRLQLWLQGSPVSYLLLQSKYFSARASELETIQLSAEQARNAPSLGTKPLIVLTGGKMRDEILEAQLRQKDLDDFQRIWVHELQSRLAALSSRSKRIVLADSGHDVPADRPDAVIEAIRELSQRMVAAPPNRRP
jgi:pimeloyl-ACP methyl ester carboxylesterase